MSGNSSKSDAAARPQFVLDVGKRVEQLDACGDSPLSWSEALNSIDRTLARLRFAAEEIDFLEARRHAVTLSALVLITVRDRGILTEHDAVAATDAAKL